MPHAPDRQHHHRTLLILGIGALAYSLAQTTVVPALASIQAEFGASTTGITWMVTGYFLAASIATPVMGRLGDMFGKERFLAISLVAFAAGSVVCALSDSLAPMVVGRALQGIGGGVFPLSFGIVRDEFPRNRVATGIAMLGAIAGIGGAIGLPLGGFLAEHAGYEWIFWISAAMGAIATVTTIRFVPESPVRTPGRVDLVGATIMGVGLTGVLIAISRANDWGWGSTTTIGLIAGGLAVLAVFAAYERRHAQPLINMATLSRRAVLMTNLATLLVGFGLFGTFILVPQLAELPKGGEVGLGLSPTEAGLLLAPGGLLMLFVAPVAGRIGERRGSKLPLVVGCLVAIVGLGGLALWHDRALQLIAWSMVLNIGVGFAFAALPNLIVDAVDGHETGEATGVNTIFRNIGGSLGSQVSAAILTASVLASGMPSDAGFRNAFLVGAAGAGVAALIALVLPRHERRGEAPAAEPAPASTR